MNNELAEVKQTELAEVADYKGIALKWLTSTGNLKKFTENEKEQFFDICVQYKLNPIKKEVYGVKYGDNFNIIVGYETYLKRAQRSGLLDGFNTVTESVGDDVKAICTIYRKDWSHPFVHEVYLSEYNTGKSLWQSKKITMIKKVAEAQAFRKCFTDELGGMPYTSEEIDVEEENKSTKEQSEAKPQTKAKIQYDKDEAAEIAEIMKALPDVFTEEKRNQFREMIKKEGSKATLEAVKELVPEVTLNISEEDTKAMEAIF